jgi:hypothetical protein
MKPLSLVLSFLPLIAFSLLARVLPSGDIGVAGLIAALCAAAAIAEGRPVWPPKIIGSCSLVLFTVAAVIGFAGSASTDKWLSTWGGAGVGLVMGLVILALVPVMPFTEQFARQTTPQAYWSSPTFKKINRVLSMGWGAAIFLLGVSRTIAAAIDLHTTHRAVEIIFSVVVPVAVLVYMFKFSKSYPEQVTKGESDTPRHEMPAR